jgi:hypothetical protein
MQPSERMRPLLQVTFTNTNPTVFIATDRNWVSELVVIFDAAGTTVSLAALQLI